MTQNATETPGLLIKEIEQKLQRGTNVIELELLSSLHTTQRLVHAIMKACDTDDFIAYNEEQKMLLLIAEHTGGSPDIIDVTSTVCAERLSCGDAGFRRSILEEFCKKVIEREDSGRSSESPGPVGQVEDDHFLLPVVTKIKAIDRSLKSRPTFRFIISLLKYLNLPQTDYSVLKSLHWFGPVPIPRGLIEILQSLIVSASKDQSPSSKTPFDNLLSIKLLRVYPSTVITRPSASALSHTSHSLSLRIPDTNATTWSITHDLEFYYVPQLISDAVRYRIGTDKDDSLTTAQKALEYFRKEDHCDLSHAAGLANMLSSSIKRQKSSSSSP